MQAFQTGLLAAVALGSLCGCGRHDFGSNSIDGAAGDAAGDAANGDGPTTSYASAILAAGPLAYWRFDEEVTPTAYDATGNGHNGTYAAVMLGRPGAVSDGNTAVEFGDSPAVGINMGESLDSKGTNPSPSNYGRTPPTLRCWSASWTGTRVKSTTTAGTYTSTPPPRHCDERE